MLALTLGALACEPTVEHYGDYDRDHLDHNRYYHEDQYDGNIYRSNRPSGWQKSSEICPVLPDKDNGYKNVDSRRPLTENVVSSFDPESRFYAVPSKAA